MEIKELNDNLTAVTTEIKSSLETQATEVKSIKANADVVAT